MQYPSLVTEGHGRLDEADAVQQRANQEHPLRREDGTDRGTKGFRPEQHG